jgi:hypothetical protein
MGILEIFQELWNLVITGSSTLNETCVRLKQIDFNNIPFTHWLGYAHYMLGTPLYTMFTSVVLISLGISLWTYTLKGIGYIKSLIPFQ